MSDIPTWHQRAMRHPDHQTGMVSEDMIRARMGEEISDLRAEVERLREALKGLVAVCDDVLDTRRGKVVHLRRLNAARAALEAKP